MLKSNHRTFLILFSILLLSNLAIGQKRIKIKMATLAPKGSPWHEVLLKLGREWQEVTNGKVILKIYQDGVAGDADAMIWMMSLGQFQAAALICNGIAFSEQ